MANNYFRFKQFMVQQKHAAMKVCTDACLFGVWVADALQRRGIQPTTILDIGTGTGLLSLMLAQKTDAFIDAIEIDETAAMQAIENFDASPWKDRLQAICGDAREIKPSKKYDLIICNPPFFEGDLKSIDERKNLALHSSDLSFEELIKISQSLLNSDGWFAVLLPYHRAESFFRIATTHGFDLWEKCLVRQTEKHDYFRCMALLGTSSTGISSEITIKKEGRYSTEFLKLLKDYYLHF